MFADIVGFTRLCQQVPPNTVLELLNDLYSKLDELVGIFNVYKVLSFFVSFFIHGVVVTEASI